MAFISLGKIDKKILYIIIIETLILLSTSLCINGINDIHIYDNLLIKALMKYVGKTLCIIPELIRNKNSSIRTSVLFESNKKISTYKQIIQIGIISFILLINEIINTFKYMEEKSFQVLFLYIIYFYFLYLSLFLTINIIYINIFQFLS